MTTQSMTLFHGPLRSDRRLRRMTASLLPAAAITCCLYGVMTSLVDVREVVLEETVQRTLTTITPLEPDKSEPTTRPKIDRLAAAVKPPPPPRPTATTADINLPAVSLSGGVPAEIGFESVSAYVLDTVHIIERETQPLSPPVPTYPADALRRGIEGQCEVFFDVDVRGRPFNIVAHCSDSVFRREAVRAVSKVEFAPKVVRGQPAERHNVVYPLTFTIDGAQ